MICEKSNTMRKYRYDIVLLTLLSAAVLSLTLKGVSAAENETRTDRINVIYFDKIPYISLIELGEIYHLPLAFDPLRIAMTIGRDKADITVTYGSSAALVKESLTNMLFPARMIRGAMYVPAETFVPLLSSIVPAELAWNAKKKGIDAAGITTTIDQVTCENFSNGSMIAIQLVEPLKYTIEMLEGRWLKVSFENGSFMPDRLFGTVSSELIREKRSFQREGYAEIAFLLSDTCGDYTANTTDGGKKILVSLRKQAVTAPVSSVTMPPAGESVPIEPDVNTQVWRIDTVVIDPGHGGKDPGAVGLKNTQEKDIVLDVAIELKKLIDKRGEIKTVLTRDKDVFVPLHKRAQMARENNGKLFISLHANASPNRSAKGFEVYFLSAAKTKDAEEVAKRENKSIELEENLTYYADFLHLDNLPKDIRDIQIDMQSSVYLKESQDMCRIIIDQACGATRLERRGVKQAGFVVMSGTQAFMPSILVEIGFISNPEEEKLLTRASYQKKLAEAIYESIIQFKQRHERGLFSGGL